MSVMQFNQNYAEFEIIYSIFSSQVICHRSIDQCYHIVKIFLISCRSGVNVCLDLEMIRRILRCSVVLSCGSPNDENKCPFLLLDARKNTKPALY